MMIVPNIMCSIEQKGKGVIMRFGMRLEGMHKEGNERLYEKKQDSQYAKAKAELEEMKQEMRAKGKEYPVHWDIDGFIPDKW